MKFRKKPVIIDAVRLLGNPDGTGPIPEGVNYGCPCGDENPDTCSLYGKYWITTLEGNMIATPGDWIITGIKGERYPCKPDIFEASYEPDTN